MRKGDIKDGRLRLNQAVKNVTFEELTAEFMRVQAIKGNAEATINSYQYCSRYFIDFIGANFPCKSINLDLIEDYVLYLKEKGINNHITLNSYLQNVGPIIKFGISKKYIIEDFKIPKIKGQNTFKDIYTDDELKALLTKPSKSDFLTMRTYTVIWTLASTGIRARELRELKLSNVDMVNQLITVNKTKNKSPRKLPISSSFYNVLSEYLVLRGGEHDDYLFPTIYNEEMAMTSLQESVKKYCREKGVYKTSLHLFRHTFITNAVNKNVNPLILQKITGHSTLKELNNYYNNRTTDMVDVIDEIAPKSINKKKLLK